MIHSFEDALTEYGMSSFEGQLDLYQEVDDNDDWNADLEIGKLTVGRHTWRCGLLGSHSEIDGTWLWGWGNTEEYPAHVLAAAEQLKGFGLSVGIPELCERKFPADLRQAHALGLIAVGLCKANAYYRAPYDGGSAFLLIKDEAFPSRAKIRPEKFMQVAAEFFKTFEVADHRKALLSYAVHRNFETTQTDSALRIQFPDDIEVVVTFDSRGRVSELRR